MLKAKNNSLNLINLCELGHRQTHWLHRLPDSRWRLCARSVRHPHDQCHGRSAQVRLRERDVGEGLPTNVRKLCWTWGAMSRSQRGRSQGPSSLRPKPRALTWPEAWSATTTMTAATTKSLNVNILVTIKNVNKKFQNDISFKRNVYFCVKWKLWKTVQCNYNFDGAVKNNYVSII